MHSLEWNDLSTVCEDERLVHLRQIACAGHLKVARFRSVCWAVLLDVLRGTHADWLLQRRVQRAMYAHIKRQWHTSPRTPPAAEQQTTQQQPSRTSSSSSAAASQSSRVAVDVDDDPLSQSQQSRWNQHFCDQELYAVIRQDVVRTFPGVDYFRRPAVQAQMAAVLFCYAREHPAMCYRQGMHEILAPVLFVMHCDQQTMLHLGELVQTVQSDGGGGGEPERME